MLMGINQTIWSSCGALFCLFMATYCLYCLVYSECSFLSAWHSLARLSVVRRRRGPALDLFFLPSIALRVITRQSSLCCFRRCLGPFNLSVLCTTAPRSFLMMMMASSKQQLRKGEEETLRDLSSSYFSGLRALPARLFSCDVRRWAIHLQWWWWWDRSAITRHFDLPFFSKKDKKRLKNWIHYSVYKGVRKNEEQISAGGSCHPRKRG